MMAGFLTHIVIALLGLCIGSFLNVVIARLPNLESCFGPRSHCRECKEKLWFRDLIPLLSYIYLQGRCRHCNASISFRYPAIELLTAVCFLTLSYMYGTTMLFLKYGILVSILIAASEIDRAKGIIPNRLLLYGFSMGLIATVFLDPVFLIDGFGAAITAGSVLLALRWFGQLLFGQPGLGMGDIKLAAVAGFFLGYPVLLGLYAAILIAGFVSIIGLLFRRLEKKSRLPFAPFIALGMLSLLVMPLPLFL